MTGPRISVVINNYNYGRFLRDAIDSALGQTYSDVELIVVDDGSTDHSRDVIAAAGDRVVPVLKSNGGQGSAINAGFARSTGDVILFLDADDMLLPTTAERVVAALAAQPDAAKVHYPLEAIDAAGMPTGELVPSRPLSSGDLRQHVLEYPRHSWPPTSGNGFPRSVLERLLPMPEEPYRVSADHYLAQLAPLLGPVIALPKPGARYRQHGANHFALAAKDRPIERLIARARNGLGEARRTKTRACQLRLARELGLPLPRDRWQHSGVKHRFVSLKLDPAHHPVPGDTLWRVAWRAVNTSLAGVHNPMARWPERVLEAGWFVIVAVVPRRAARSLIEQRYFPSGGGWLGRAIMGWRRRQVRAGTPAAALQKPEPRQANPPT